MFILLYSLYVSLKSYIWSTSCKWTIVKLQLSCFFPSVFTFASCLIALLVSQSVTYLVSFLSVYKKRLTSCKSFTSPHVLYFCRQLSAWWLGSFELFLLHLCPPLQSVSPPQPRRGSSFLPSSEVHHRVDLGLCSFTVTENSKVILITPIQFRGPGLSLRSEQDMETLVE
jgi:hypothetical protein